MKNKGTSTNNAGPKTVINTDITFKKMSLSKINPSVYNPRQISDANLSALRISLERFGLVQPIIVNIRDGRNVIVGGHQRFKVLLSEGVTDSVCVIIDRSESDERLLNFTLNNPAASGEFIDDLDAYIDSLSSIVEGESDLLDLRILEMRSQVADDQELSYIEERLVPYKKTHVLLSFPPELLADVEEHLNRIVNIEGVDYEQCSN